MDYPQPKSLAQLNRLIGLFAYYSEWLPDSSSLTQAHTNARDDVVKHGNLPTSAKAVIQKLKAQLNSACLQIPDFNRWISIETDASPTALGGTLSQDRQPIAFFSRSLSQTEIGQSIIEREACAIFDCIKRWFKNKTTLFSTHLVVQSLPTNVLSPLSLIAKLNLKPKTTKLPDVS